MRPTINTEKHIIQESFFTIASGAVRTDTIALAVRVPATTLTHVREGAKISAVYCEIWLTGDDAVQGSTIVTLEKRNLTQTAMTAGDAAALHEYGNKKNILHTFQGLLPSNTQYPMAAIKGWFRIPKGKQRFGLDDTLVLNIFAQSDGVNGCGFYIYKEQF